MTTPPEPSHPAAEAAGAADDRGPDKVRATEASIAATDASIAALASACAAHLPQAAATFAGDVRAFDDAWQQLLTAMARSDARFGFDRDGRPAAIDAVRRALPAVERELFDVILEDVACELAATQEALYRVAITIRDGSAPGRR
ncbi:MAG TPA: hypothetical protein VL173_04165 [Vicinamibacterales bacterium]|nr:hypothetical protein [Vicinamibacterales bacterium]